MKGCKAIFCWSGGKDSAFALHKVRQEGKFEVVALLTTLNAHHNRISMHGVRESMLNLQATALDLPLEKAWVRGDSNEEYELVMEEKFFRFKEEGVTHVLYGDIFLQDLRRYRENMLERTGLIAEFPLWEKETGNLMREFLRAGFETITCCVSSKWLDDSFVGITIDEQFLLRLPEHVDPCGENGEYHSYCYKGPIFKKEIPVRVGEKLFRPIPQTSVFAGSGFWFADLLPG